MRELTAKPERPTDCHRHRHRHRHRQGGWGRAFLPAAAAWLLVACNATGQSVDLATESSDMTVVADLASGPSCGKLVLCIVQCGLGKLSCDTQCTAGASATEAMKAGALALCAGLSCAGSDAGTDLPAILGCLLTNCQSQVLACDGLLI